MDKALRRLRPLAMVAGLPPVHLRPITLSIESFVGSAVIARRRPPTPIVPEGAPCVFCGVHSGRWQTTCRLGGDAPVASPACPLCVLSRRLDRPRIDEEAILIWLPQMSQQAVNTIIRQIHIELRALGELLGDDDALRVSSPGRHALCSARAELAARADSATSRLGTAAPSELGVALCQLSPSSYARRGALLGGLRLLPRGRLLEADRDIYPEIVDTWIALAKAASEQHPPQASAEERR